MHRIQLSLMVICKKKQKKNVLVLDFEKKITFLKRKKIWPWSEPSWFPGNSVCAIKVNLIMTAAVLKNLVIHY